MYLPDWMVIVCPEAARNIIAANARIAVVVLEAVPLRMVQDIREQAVCVIDNAPGPSMSSREVVDVFGQKIVVEILHPLSIVLDDCLPIFRHHWRSL